jgi:PGF-pre-PGF domain-containing protein
MEKKSLHIFLFFLISIFFLTGLVSAVPPVCDWRGYARIDNTLINTSHVIMSYTNDSQPTNGTIFSDGYYVLPVPGIIGDNVTFKICGVYVNESYRTWGCGGVGYNLLNLSINKSSDGAACTYACGCSGGYCNSGVCASSATTTSTPTTVSGPGGGGGGTTSVATTTATTAVTTTTIPQQETEKVTKIENGTSATFTLNQSDVLKVESINVEVKNTVNNVEITVKESSQPAGANVAISSDTGAVYKYLEITKTNVKDADINKVKIKFKVEKSWATANSIDPATITLQRLVGNDWVKLTTNKVSEDSTYYYFEAESPGLSVFAVTGVKKLVTTTTVARTTVPATTAPIPPVVPKFSAELYIIVIVMIIGAVLVIFSVLKRKKPKIQY